jgi:hypothetical protein
MARGDGLSGFLDIGYGQGCPSLRRLRKLVVPHVACAAVKTWEDFLPEAARRVEAATEEFGPGLVMMADDVKPDVYVSALKRWPVTSGATGRGVDDALRRGPCVAAR